jgi:alginate O-acetyltransferase complex protein AlgI
MLFNSFNYFLFLPLVFIIYYILPFRFRWVVLFVSSILFYMFGGAKTIAVPIIIIICTYICGILIENNSNVFRKKTFFLLGVFINLGLLGFFKYINFFIASAYEGFHFVNNLFGIETDVNHKAIVLNLLVPLGISYITFQAIGYLIEINRANQICERNIWLFATYILFFPKLASGPIERAHNFLPQLRQKHEFDKDLFVGGLKRILWGLFLKLVVANRLALYTDAVFGNSDQHTGSSLLVASVFFAVQLFADLAGYSEIAIGSSLIFGFRIMENFDRPFLAKSVTEFWRKWHISLTNWVNEYIYNPIVIKYRSWNKWAVMYAVMITFLILGFWHCASWTYIIFGFLQGVMLIIEFLSRKIRKQLRNKIPSLLNTFLGISFTFGFFCFSAVFFKASSVKIAFSIIAKIFTFNGPIYIGSPSMMIYSIFGILLLTITGLFSQFYKTQNAFFNNKYWIIRKISYVFLIILILLIGVFDGGQFIYFQF